MKDVRRDLLLVTFLVFLFWGQSLSQVTSENEELFSDANGVGKLSELQNNRLKSILARQTTRNVQLVFVRNVSSLREKNSIVVSLFGYKALKLNRGIGDNWRFANDKASGGSLIVDGEDLIGTVTVGHKLYKIEPIGRGLHAIIDVNSAAFPEEHPIEQKKGSVNNNESKSELDNERNQSADQPAAISGNSATTTHTFIEVLVAYTPSAAGAHGNIAGLIKTAISETNQSYVNSGVAITLRLSHIERVNYTESGSFETDLIRFQNSSDGYMDDIHTLRDRFRADLCVLIINNGASCGLAFAINADASTAFSAVHYDCATGYYSFGHELGHLQGARHDRYVDGTNFPFQYGHGFVYTSGSWRTIMAYNDQCAPGNCTRLQYWSNPNVTYGGTAMGTTTYENNARVLNETANGVIGFRTSTNIYVPQDYSTIASGLSAATSGQNVIVDGTQSIGSSINVNSGITLQIIEGSTWNFAGATNISISGSLTVGGSTFTRSGGNDWQGITLSGASNSWLKYCTINYAQSPIVANNTTNLTINNCTIGYSQFLGTDPYWSEAAIACYGSSVNISSTTITGTAGLYSKNGIRFASGSTGSITSSTIQNCDAGNGIVIQGGSSPTIQYNTITNNYYHGIVLPSNSGGFPLIHGNTITYNGQSNYVGIIIDNSPAEISSNTVHHSAGGIYSVNYGYIRASDFASYYDQGNNIVTNTNLGLLASGNSSMYMGYTQGSEIIYFYGACNHVYDNLSNAQSNYGGYLIAQGNWWGSPSPDPAKFSTYQGTLDYSYWRAYPQYDCPPEGGGCSECASVIASYQPQDAVAASMLAARKALFLMQFDEAKRQFKSVFANTGNSEDRVQALVGLYNVFRGSKESGLIAEIEQYRSASGKLGLIASEITAFMYAMSGDFSKAQAIANDLKARNPGSEYEKKALLFLASLGGRDQSLKAMSSAAIGELRQKFASSVDEGILVALGGAATGGSKAQSSVASEASGEELSSYPNPFNPSTKIQYRLSNDGLVSLKVYDVLGREVVSLVDELKSAGTYTVTWDASRMPSGIYFTRLETAGKALVKKLMLVK